MKGRADRHYRLPRFMIHFLLDMLATAGAWSFAYFIRFHVIPEGQEGLGQLFFILGFPVCIVMLYFLLRDGLYANDLTLTWRKQASKIFLATCQMFLTLVVVCYFFVELRISRLHIALFCVFLFCFLNIGRWISSGILYRLYRKKKWVQRLLLVGRGERLESFAANAEGGVHAGLMVVGRWKTGEGKDTVEASSLAEAVERSDADIVVVGYPPEAKSEESAVTKEGMDLLQARLLLLPDIPPSYIGTELRGFHHIAVLELNAKDMSMLDRMVKRTFDIAAALIAITLLSPVFLILAFLVRVTSKGPVLFRQKRVTRGGKVFTMLKFRSMRIDMPEQGGAHWTEENDPRVTKVGRLMRRTSLDELPQFFNVLGGSMSLVGPRPERPELVEQFKKEIPGYNMRHRVKAGITGWAQVNGLRGNTSLTKRIEFDLYYIRNWSFWFDIKICFLTFFRGFINKNAY